MSAQMKPETESTSIDANVIDRRTFLKLTGFAGGGLMLAFSSADKFAHAYMINRPGETFIPNGFIQISSDGQILIYAKNPEIGQGIKTTLPMIVAEELDADWADVRVETAPTNKAVYGRQASWGSMSIRTSWDQLRRAGAVARAMLVSAAADEWGVPVSSCQTGASQVTHSASGRHLSYGALADKAALLPVPDPRKLTLKKRSEYTLLGTRITGVDNEALVKGEPLFGIDTVVPNMHYATYEKCPATGGVVVSANLDEIKALPGVTDAFILEGTGKVTELMPGVAIVARSTWAAFQAKSKLKVEWDETNAAKNSWTEDVKKAAVLAKGDGKQVLVEYGDTDAAYANAAKTVESYYSYPFMAHATMEPMNCTAWVRDGMAEIWAPTQSPQVVSPKFFKSIGIDVKKVTVYPTRSGGGFGRRGQNDFLCEAAAISKQAGVPVKLQYTREDDMKHDHYRPGAFHSFKGAIDKQGKLSAWQDHFITFTQNGKRTTRGGNLGWTKGKEEFPVPLVPNAHITQSMLPLKVPTGPWRAPGASGIAFATESFFAEMSHAAGRDHVEFMIEVLGKAQWLVPGNPMSLNTGRAVAVIKLVAEKAGWGKALPKGRGMGFAFHFSHSAHFAHVAEVSVDARKKLTVHKITAAGDVGPILNISGAESQAEGGIIDGMSTMLGLSLSIENGQIQETNFHQYPLMRINSTPDIAIHFIQSDFPPTGLGEPTLPPVAPAICNAIFAVTGERIRELPLSKAGYTA